MFMMAGLFIMPARSGMPPPIPGKPGIPPAPAPPAPAPAPARGETDAESSAVADEAPGARERAVASEDFMVAFCESLGHQSLGSQLYPSRRQGLSEESELTLGSSSSPFSYASTASAYCPVEKRACPRRE